jgi:hypothetical protein
MRVIRSWTGQEAIDATPRRIVRKKEMDAS